MQDDRLCEFVYSDGFLEDAEGLLDEDALRAPENELLEDPRRGRTIRGTGGFRKFALQPKGEASAAARG